MDNSNFVYYQVTTRTANRFSQLDRWMQSNLDATIIIPGFHVDSKDNINKDYLDQTSDLFFRNQHALIEINNVVHYHILGITSDVKELIQTITYCIKKLVNKYSRRIMFGLVGKNTGSLPELNNIHLWESNESNIAPDIITKFNREDLTIQRDPFTYEDIYIFGINTMRDNDLGEVAYRAQTASSEYLINYFNPSYIYNPAITPTSYSRYRNSSNSCYFAGLWAFLHKPENPVMESILEQLDRNLNRDQNKITLINYLNQYYLNAHTLDSDSSRSKFQQDLSRFRNFLEWAFKFNSIGQQDTSELINTINNQFDNIIYNNTPPLESSLENYLPTNDTNIVSPNNSNVTYSINCYYNIETNNFIGKKTDEPIIKSVFPMFTHHSNIIIEYRQNINSIVIEENKLDVTEGTGAIVVDGKQITTYDSNSRHFLFKKKLVQYIYNPKYFSVYNKRFQQLGKKDETEYNIADNYGPFELYSIVVHGGGASGGHYTCYFKHDSKWYEFNDCGAKISSAKNPVNDVYNKSNWVLLVYFKENLNNIPFLDIPIPNYSPSFDSPPRSSSSSPSSSSFSSSSSSLSNKVIVKYGLKPATGLLITLLIIYFMSKNEESSSDDKDLFWSIGVLSIIISELVSPDEPIIDTVSKFINYLFELIGLKKPFAGGGNKFNLSNSVKFIIDKVSSILTEWYYQTDRSEISLKQIIKKFKSNNFVQQLEFTELVKSPEYTLSIIKSNKSSITNLIIAQQIQLLRALRWKVNMTPLGPLLIDWDQWIKLLNPQEQKQINETIKTNPWIKYSIQSYIYNINLNHPKLLNK